MWERNSDNKILYVNFPLFENLFCIISDFFLYFPVWKVVKIKG